MQRLHASTDDWRTRARRAARIRRQFLRLLVNSRRPLVVANVLSALVAALLPAALVVSGGVLTGRIQRAVAHGGALGPVYWALIVVFVLFLAGEVLAPVQGGLRWLLILSVDGEARDHVMEATLSGTDMTHLHGAEYLGALERVRGFVDYQGTPGGGAAGIVTVARDYLTGLAFAAVIAWFQPLIALLALAVGLFVRLTWRAVMIEAVNAWTDGLPDFDEARYFVELGLGRRAANEVRLFGLGEWLGQRIRAAGIRGWAPSWRQRSKRAAPKVMLHMVLSAAAMVAGLVWAGVAAAHGRLFIGQLVIFVPSLFAVIGLGRVFNDDVTVEYGASMLPAMNTLDRLAADAVAQESGRRPVDTDRAPSIELRDVTFRYPGAETNVVEDVNLSVPAGGSAALVGLNGAGKTTLVRLLCGLYRPLGGAVLVNGVDIRELDIDAWHRLIAPMFQEFLRLQVTVGDNVAVGAVERSGDREGVEQALAEAGAREFTERLPDGLDTLLSVGQAEGTDLSGGQWQRLGIARALFALHAGARFVVLDEPTSNLDTSSEERLVRRLLDQTRGSVTSLLITHRLALARRTDRIYVLERGRLVEEGSHTELLRVQGRYASAFAMQASLYPLEEDGGG